jgi:two-component system nitrogen regulation response regulator GlnG
LVRHFLRRFGRELGKKITDISPEAIRLLRDYPWPGNIRELQSVVKHALLQATGPVLAPAFLPDFLRNKSARFLAAAAATAPSAVTSQTRLLLEAGSMNIYAEVTNQVERELIAEVLRFTDGNLSLAAKRLGISRTTLRAKLASLSISIERRAAVDDR